MDGNEAATVTPGTILQFFTGADRHPPAGFPFKLTLEFNHDEKSLPIANTCSGTLIMPVRKETLDADSMKKWLSSMILNSLGFTRP